MAPERRSSVNGAAGGIAVGANRSGDPLPPKPARVAHASMVSSNRPSLRSANATMFGNEPENCAIPSRTDQLHRRQVAGPGQVGNLVVAFVQQSRRVHPPQDVLATIGPRHSDVLPDGERDVPPRAVQFTGDLDSARRGADDENAAVGKLARVAVVRRRERGDVYGHAALQRRHFGDRVGPSGEHHGSRMPQVLVGLHQVSTIGLPHRHHGGVGAHGRRRLLGVALNQLDDVGSGEVAIGVVASVGVTRKPGHPVGGEQAQRIPPLRAPGVRYLTAFQYDMVDRTVG